MLTVAILAGITCVLVVPAHAGERHVTQRETANKDYCGSHASKKLKLDADMYRRAGDSPRRGDDETASTTRMPLTTSHSGSVGKALTSFAIGR